MASGISGEASRKSYTFSLRTGSRSSEARSSRLEKASRFLASEREPAVLLFVIFLLPFGQSKTSLTFILKYGLLAVKKKK